METSEVINIYKTDKKTIKKYIRKSIISNLGIKLLIIIYTIFMINNLQIFFVTDYILKIKLLDSLISFLIIGLLFHKWLENKINLNLKTYTEK